MTARRSNKEVSVLSPLRYPGAKRKLWTYIRDAITLNALRPKLFVEPFAGGASVTLQLLANDVVDEAALSDSDPLVSSFWRVLFFDTDWLIEQVRTIPVTLPNWQRFKTTTWATDRERALACLFLNRTSFSGIMADSAGPIGGYAQESDYKINCRFTVDTLVRRIRTAAALAPRVRFVDTCSWNQTMTRVRGLGYAPRDLFIYLDPPFYHKADKLYRHFFTEADHLNLRDQLVALGWPWLLSYDPAPRIMELYSGDQHSTSTRVDLLYSTKARGPLVNAEELIITNLATLPIRPPKKKKPRKKKRSRTDKPETGPNVAVAPSQPTGKVIPELV